MRKSIAYGVVLSLCVLLLCAPVVGAATLEQVAARWEKSKYYEDDAGANLTIKCTYYSAEYIEAYIQSEAKKNMWTQSEMEDYKYNFLKALNLNESIPIYIEFVNNGSTMYLGPFDTMVTLRLGNKAYKPSDYDKRFNFSFQGKKDGLVFFPRYDEKTGKNLLDKVKTARIEFKSAISPTLDGKSPFMIWNVADDDPQKLYQGKSAARFETDRLLKRLEKLRKDEAELQKQLKSVQDEKTTIQTRLDELAKQ